MPEGLARALCRAGFGHICFSARARRSAAARARAAGAGEPRRRGGPRARREAADCAAGAAAGAPGRGCCAGPVRVPARHEPAGALLAQGARPAAGPARAAVGGGGPPPPPPPPPGRPHGLAARGQAQCAGRAAPAAPRHPVPVSAFPWFTEPRAPTGNAGCSAPAAGFPPACSASRVQLAAITAGRPEQGAQHCLLALVWSASKDPQLRLDRAGPNRST